MQPTYRDIYSRIRDEILTGHLPSGGRLPSARSYASQLGIARGTVDHAYQLLIAEGYLETRSTAGTFVPHNLTAQTTEPAASPPQETSLPHQTFIAGKPGLFQMGLPALDAFPRKSWARIAGRMARQLPIANLDHQDPIGFWPLRTAIAGYLKLSRGISCLPDQIFITAGYQASITMVCQAILNKDDKVWMEDPGYFRAIDAIKRLGGKVTPVSVDHEGLQIALACAQAPDARLALVTPTHHFPTTVTMPVPRRQELLAWAGQADAYILEDDYDSEFRYTGPPLPALKSLDSQDRVFFAGTFSKVLFSGLRIAYLVVPVHMVDRMRSIADLLLPPPSPLIQSTVATFMAEGFFARHIKRMRKLYGERRQALHDALIQHCPSLTMDLCQGGMHIMAMLPPGTDDRALSKASYDQGLAADFVSRGSSDNYTGSGLLLNFTNVPTDMADQAACALQQILDKKSPGR
ncbi:MocR-like pyridoxine biosynthesis transcription factor PdxR [Aestuariispira ectoiniformans]|uniref:MocR-like pyridoxine biosynthesis transcription factor PdxR n=1 Tax=Aestuariispira ectoiniformans TaxID=2775080 RepID=UPI00223C2306|nr:PLP-dependent aminotransferase family protein [Aestuariispira ectoiniformans]